MCKELLINAQINLGIFQIKDLMKLKIEKEDLNNLEKAKDVAITMLKNGVTYQYPSNHHSQFDQFVEFASDVNIELFMERFNEVTWEFLIQGILTPGFNITNRGFPYTKLTDFGKSVVEQERPTPYDPNSFIDSIKSKQKLCVSSTTISYLEEALNCFNHNCFISSVLILGVASESVFIGLCDVIGKSSQRYLKFVDLYEVSYKRLAVSLKKVWK
jgi:hypothetical protein